MASWVESLAENKTSRGLAAWRKWEQIGTWVIVLGSKCKEQRGPRALKSHEPGIKTSPFCAHAGWPLFSNFYNEKNNKNPLSTGHVQYLLALSLLLTLIVFAKIILLVWQRIFSPSFISFFIMIILIETVFNEIKVRCMGCFLNHLLLNRRTIICWTGKK